MAAIEVKYQPTPAAELYREKLLLRQRSDLPNRLVVLPSAQYSAKMASHPEASKLFVKAMLQCFASAIVENASREGSDWHAGTLARFQEVGGRMEFLLMCASPKLASSMLARLEQSTRKDMSINDNLDGIQIEYQFGMSPATFVPIVFSYSHQKRHVLITNRSHMTNPAYFLDPRLADCSSAFLNFLGTLSLISEIDPQKQYADQFIAKSEQVRTGKLDEWLRWFYCLVDTGEWFDQNRLMIDPDNPEVFYYDYSPAVPAARE